MAAVENPQIPPAAFLSGIMKPVTAVGAGATVLGLAAMFGLAAGYKRDTLVYNERHRRYHQPGNGRGNKAGQRS